MTCPWAIIRLVQRAGRVDRIGQEAENILCYSFLPTEGVERIIAFAWHASGNAFVRMQRLLARTKHFLKMTDDNDAIVDLYHERARLA